MTAAAWTLIFFAALSLWWPRLRVLSVALLGGGYLFAAGAALLDRRAGIILVLLLVSAYGIAPKRTRPWRIGSHLVFLALAAALGFHLLPGFQNLRVIGPRQFTPDAVPFTMYLNLDKPLAGFWLILAWPAFYLHRDGWRGLARGLSVGVATTAVCLGLGLALGKLAFAPKWPALGWLWASNNLLLVCMTEEALFRGYLQEALSRRLAGHLYGDAVAIGIAAALFGVAHVAGGTTYAMVAGLAGVGYGVAYRCGGLRAAVLVHFGLNLTHFTLFTYPMVAT